MIWSFIGFQVLKVLVFVFLVLSCVKAAGWILRESRKRRPNDDKALNLLKTRFASGAIGEEEFRRRREVLLKQ